MTSTFEILADFLPEPMAVVSSSGLIRAANHAFAALVETDRSTLTGQSLTDVGWSAPDGWPE
ncbi:MAG TPA: hypothetical protein VGD94_15575 [Vicinamibacterales bacterium]